MTKLLRFFLFLGVILLFSQISCDKPPEGEKKPDPDGHTPVVAIYASSVIMNLPVADRAELNGIKNPLHLHTILLPYNCSVSFVLVNEGPVGTVLNYSIDDIGALGGFLDYTNGVGSLKSGEFATITVTVDPNFTRTGLGGLGEGYGSTLVLTINTPGASNGIKNVVSVHVLDFATEVQKLIGTWKGTWSGVSTGPKKTTPVNGTWTLNLQTVDWLNGTVTATLTWSGIDAWWDNALNDAEANNSMPHSFNVNRSFVFSNLISSINGPRPCFDGVSLHLPHSKYFGYFEEIGYVPDPTNPDFHFGFSTDLKSILGGLNQTASSWSSMWLDPIVKGHYGYSSGFLQGSKVN
ncbi:MAG: hypothetical protein M0Q53_02750 [Prolixibacteraceae bacterium]|jgi:hypothetical protein|nr:hypothetical protein [Prolixibacteraceae bacterium]